MLDRLCIEPSQPSIHNCDISQQNQLIPLESPQGVLRGSEVQLFGTWTHKVVVSHINSSEL